MKLSSIPSGSDESDIPHVGYHFDPHICDIIFVPSLHLFTCYVIETSSDLLGKPLTIFCNLSRKRLENLRNFEIVLENPGEIGKNFVMYHESFM